MQGGGVPSRTAWATAPISPPVRTLRRTAWRSAPRPTLSPRCSLQARTSARTCGPCAPLQRAHRAPSVPVTFTVWWCSQPASVCEMTAYRPPGKSTHGGEVVVQLGLVGPVAVGRARTPTPARRPRRSTSGPGRRSGSAPRASSCRRGRCRSASRRRRAGTGRRHSSIRAYSGSPIGPGVDHLLDPAPERRQPQLVADGQHPAPRPGERDQLVAVVDGEGHRLFEQQVPARLEHGPADLVVQVRRQHDVARRRVAASASSLAVVGVDADARVVGGGVGAARLGAGGDGDQLGPGTLRRWPGRGGRPRPRSRSGRIEREAVPAIGGLLRTN